MSDTVRAEIESKMASLKLQRDIAVEARNDDLLKFVNTMTGGYEGIAARIIPRFEEICKTVPSVSIKHNDETYSFVIDFKAAGSNDIPSVVIPSVRISSYIYSISPGTDNACMIILLGKLVSKLSDLERFVNSPSFKSYAADIKMYTDTLVELKAHDVDMRKKRIAGIASSFKTGQMIANPNDFRSHAGNKIVSVGMKKIKFERAFHPEYNYHIRQLYKEEVAERIADGSWHFV